MFLAASLIAADARADESAGALRLEWVAPGECPTRDAVTAKIEALTGPRGSETAAAASVSIGAPRGGSWNASVSIRRDAAESTRTLTAASCAELADGVVVMIALVLGPSAEPAKAATPSEPAPEVSAEPTPPVVRSAPSEERDVRATAVATARSSRPVFGAAAVALVEAQTRPGVTYGVGVLFSAATERLRAEIGASTDAVGDAYRTGEIAGRFPPGERASLLTPRFSRARTERWAPSRFRETESEGRGQSPLSGHDEGG